MTGVTRMTKGLDHGFREKFEIFPSEGERIGRRLFFSIPFPGIINPEARPQCCQ